MDTVDSIIGKKKINHKHKSQLHEISSLLFSPTIFTKLSI